MESLKITAHVGTTIPLLAGAVGKAFLCHESPGRVRELIGEKGLPRYSPKSITDIDDYLAELDRVRSMGYAIDDEEYLSGIRAVAVALDNRRGLPMAVWVVGIASNMEMARLKEVADLTTVAVKKLRLQLDGNQDRDMKAATGAENPGNLEEQVLNCR